MATAKTLAARAAAFEFKCASDLPEEHPASVRFIEMWRSIEQESGGRIHTQYFPNSILGGDTAMLSQVRLGATQFSTVSPGNLAPIVPAADIAYLGFAYKDSDEALRVMRGPVGDYVAADAATKGLHLFRNMWDSGMFVIASSTHPIRVPDDLRGFKIRVNNSKIQIDLFKALDASPTPVSTSEVYTALQTKVVDGTGSALVSIASMHWYEVQKYISVTNHGWAGNWLAANLDAWKSLPGDLQDVIERNTAKYAALERADTKRQSDAAVPQMARLGLPVNQVDQTPFRGHLQAYYQTWARAFGSTEWGLLESALGHKLA